MAIVHFERPSDGKRRHVSSRWRVWGFIFGIPAMLFAGLWLHSGLALAGTVLLGLLTERVTGLGEGDPDYLFTYWPGWLFLIVYGAFIPELRIRKYERLGWKRVEAADEF